MLSDISCSRELQTLQPYFLLPHELGRDGNMPTNELDALQDDDFDAYSGGAHDGLHAVQGDDFDAYSGGAHGGSGTGGNFGQLPGDHQYNLSDVDTDADSRSYTLDNTNARLSSTSETESDESASDQWEYDDGFDDVGSLCSDLASDLASD